MNALHFFILVLLSSTIIQSKDILPNYATLFPESWNHFLHNTLSLENEDELPITSQCISSPHKSQNKDCSIIIESQWQDLDNNLEKAHKFGGKWILAGTITFKKKCNSQVNLQEIRFQWHGNQIDHLQGSLFIAKNSTPFKPINENHIADSSWGKESRILKFKFNNPLSLHPTTVFYLVLTIPEEQEQRIKGYFTLLPTCLPTQFQENAQKDPLSINLDIIGSSVH